MKRTEINLNTVKIIGISGFIGCGKSTVGNILYNEYGYKIASFAAKVKDAVSIIYGWDRALLEGDTKESREFRDKPDAYWSAIMEKPTTPRRVLQEFGTDIMRKNVHNDIWIHALVKELSENPDDKYVITDVRFPNEFKALKKMNGFMMTVSRGDNPEWYETALRCNMGEDHLYLDMMGIAHPSEWSWIGQPYDLNVRNDSDIDTLKKNLGTLFPK